MFFPAIKLFTKKISSDPQNNNYTRLGYLYDSRAAGISIEYSLDGGLYLGLRLKTIKQGFRKEPYSYKSIFVVNRAINSSSYHIGYYADFIKVFGKTDLLFRSDALLPTSRTLFFGIGNNTVFDKTKPGGHEFYFGTIRFGEHFSPGRVIISIAGLGSGTVQFFNISN
jgi:hypothetical protein